MFLLSMLLLFSLTVIVCAVILQPKPKPKYGLTFQGEPNSSTSPSLHIPKGISSTFKIVFRTKVDSALLTLQSTDQGQYASLYIEQGFLFMTTTNSEPVKLFPLSVTSGWSVTLSLNQSPNLITTTVSMLNKAPVVTKVRKDTQYTDVNLGAGFKGCLLEIHPGATQLKFEDMFVPEGVTIKLC